MSIFDANVVCDFAAATIFVGQPTMAFPISNDVHSTAVAPKTFHHGLPLKHMPIRIQPEIQSMFVLEHTPDCEIKFAEMEFPANRHHEF